MENNLHIIFRRILYPFAMNLVLVVYQLNRRSKNSKNNLLMDPIYSMTKKNQELKRNLRIE